MRSLNRFAAGAALIGSLSGCKEKSGPDQVMPPQAALKIQELITPIHQQYMRACDRFLFEAGAADINVSQAAMDRLQIERAQAITNNGGTDTSRWKCDPSPQNEVTQFGVRTMAPSTSFYFGAGKESIECTISHKELAPNVWGMGIQCNQ